MLSISGYGRSGPLAGFRAVCLEHQQLPRPDVGLGTRRHPLRLRRRDPRGMCRRRRAEPRSTRGPTVSSSTWRRPRRVPPSWPRLYLDYLANGREWSAGPNEVPGSLFSGGRRCVGCRRLGGHRARGRAGLGGRCARSWSDPISASTPAPRRLMAVARPPGVAARGCRRVGGDGHTVPSEPTAAAARAGRRSRAEQRGPVAGRATSQPRRLRRGLPSRPRVHWSIRTPRCRPPRPAGRGPVARGSGEHTGEVLREWLACSESEVDDLRTSSSRMAARATSDPSAC